MQVGTVKFFNESKGFGFISPQDADQDIFVHTSGLVDQIRQDDRVEFTIVEGKKGLNAVDVRVL